MTTCIGIDALLASFGYNMYVSNKCKNYVLSNISSQSLPATGKKLKMYAEAIPKAR
jgi:hypothetical protein